ncbi:MAG: dockerin type I repeat-containing protein [Acutalibacteraceae bacterium]
MKKRKSHYKGRIISILLALCIALSIAPITAFAGVTDVTAGTSTVYNHTYHTKVKLTANVTVQDSDGNTVDTYQVSEESDFIEGNVSDDAVKAEITRIEESVYSQLPSGAVKSKRSTSLTFDHFESSNIINQGEDGEIVNTLDVHEYQIYAITEDWTVRQDDYAINNVAINNAPTSCTVGEAPTAMATKGDNEAYTYYEYWEEWVQTENGMEPVKFWYSDADRMSRVPDNQILTAFEEGKKYLYSIIAQPKDGYTFADKDALCIMLNGEDISNSGSVQLYDNNGEKLLEIMGKFMTPTNTVYGDVDSNGKINLLDLIALRKHLAKWDIDIDLSAADCNCDGKINLLDLIQLRKYLAKWDVVLGPQPL